MQIGTAHDGAIMANGTVVLVHSPLVGPTTWDPVARALVERGRQVALPSLLGMEDSPAPFWRWAVDRLLHSLASEEGPLTLVAHSGAGPLLPIVGAEADREISSYVFVDATIPAPTGSTPVVPAEFLPSLEALVERGRLPRWSQWWDEGTMRALVPDDGLRRRLEEEMPSLPMAYFSEAIPVPTRWPDAPCAYILFSEAYEPVAADARFRGWPTRRIAGEHLHIVVDPESVAQALIEMV